MPLPSPTPSARGWRARLRASGQLFVANTALLALVSTLYLAHAPRPGSLAAALYLGLGLVSSAAAIAAGPGLVLALLALLVRSPRVLAWMSAGAWTFVVLALFTDTVIYGIFRYHFNSMVWNVLTTPGADEALHLGARDLAQAGAGALVLLLLELRLARWRLAREGAGGEPPVPAPLALRPAPMLGLVILPLTLAQVGIYAWADLWREREVTALARLYPLAPRLTIKRFAREHLGVVLEERPEVELPGEGILLAYPRRPIPAPAVGPRPNLLIVVVDSLRADVLDGETMPHASALARRGRRFDDHLSSGNATRFGLFGMLYGLHGSYWPAVYHEQRSPVLVDTLLALGYRMRVLTSASMSYPELRSTAWVRIEDQVEDRLRGEREGGRDDGTLERFRAWLGERSEPERPFFAFALLDAPHQGYSFPAEHARFRPYAEGVDYLDLAHDPDPAEVAALFNRYRNAVHYADSVLGAMLAALEEHGLAEETLVLVTGDHGEEFLENGFLGHTSNFSDEQVRVPLLLAGPGIPPGVEERPTSHLDVPATLLELLGLDPALRSDWTLGANLLAPQQARVRVVSGWSELALWSEDSVVVVPTAARAGAIDCYDDDWDLVHEDRAILRAAGAVLGGLALDCRRYLR